MSEKKQPYAKDEANQRLLDTWIRHVHTVLAEAFASKNPEAYMEGRLVKVGKDKKYRMATDSGVLKVWIQALDAIIAVEKAAPTDAGERLKHLKAIRTLFQGQYDTNESRKNQ